MKSDRQCRGQVHDRYMFRSRRCQRNGSARREDGWYCKPHDPVRRAAEEEDAREREREQEARSEKIGAEMRALCDDLGAGVPQYGRETWEKTTSYKRRIVLTEEEACALIERLRVAAS